MQLRQQMIVMAALPLLGLIALGTYLCADKFQNLQLAHATQDRVLDVQTLTELTHVLQVERGQSTGFVESEGENFGDTLPAARSNTDAAVAQLPEFATHLQRELT